MRNYRIFIEFSFEFQLIPIKMKQIFITFYKLWLSLFTLSICYVIIYKADYRWI